MSAYHGRPGPNFSEYINNLNNTPQPYAQDFLAPTTDHLNLDHELALFTDTDFTDFDSLGQLPDPVLNFDFGSTNKPADTSIKYDNIFATPSPSINPQPSQPSPVQYYPNYQAPIQPAPPASTFPQVTSYASPIHHASPVPQLSSPQGAGLKRKADAINASPQELPSDQKNRLAAEEDKRRRNTAASARFRVKKKQREQALERTVKEVNDENTALHAKISQLEMENKWLKNLIVEKNGKQTKEEIAEAYQQYRRESEERDTSKGNERKEGVGES